jgi:hypothetical protein
MHQPRCRSNDEAESSRQGSATYHNSSYRLQYDRSRSNHEVESSRQGSATYHNSSYRPQYDRRTLAPSRGSPPRLYNNTRRPLVPSRFNSQANQDWRMVSPN